MGAAGAGTEETAGERGRLINVAYRLLGSLAEAEDAVQEAFARWYALPRSRRDEIVSPGAWLTTVTGRICLDVLGSARVRRERYVGAWLPDPLPDPVERGGGRGSDLADRMVLDESVT
ncbi:sigma factor, partial [Streptomyces anulatus]